MSAARVEFAGGGLLAAGDLNAAIAYENRLRCNHVRGVHGARGIALGYSLAIDSTGARVLVGPGLAYDCRGRELVSSRTVHVPAPEDERRSFLVVGPPAAAPCCPSSVETPEVSWHWRSPGCVPEGEVALGGFVVADRRLREIDLTVRRGAARRRHLRVAAGTHTEEGWLPEQEVEVPTAAAGFSGTPFYFATLGLADNTQELFGPRAGVLGPWVELHSPTKTSFRITLWFAGPLDYVAGIGAGERFHVHWVGVEPGAACLVPELEVPADQSGLIPVPPSGGSLPVEVNP